MNNTLKLAALTFVLLLAPSLAFASSSSGTPLDGIIMKLANFISGPMAFLLLISGIGAGAWSAMGNKADVSTWIQVVVGVVAIVGFLMGVAGIGRSWFGLGAEIAPHSLVVVTEDQH